MSNYLPRATWLTSDEIEQLSGPKGQRVAMGMKYYTGRIAEPVERLQALYSGGCTEFTYKDDDAKASNWTILLHQEAKKAGVPVTGEVSALSDTGNVLNALCAISL
jgi:hypothetical protein